MQGKFTKNTIPSDIWWPQFGAKFKSGDTKRFMLRLEKTLMAEILSTLRDGGEHNLMNGENNPDGINLPRLWLLFFRIGKTYRVTS